MESIKSVENTLATKVGASLRGTDNLHLESVIRRLRSAHGGIIADVVDPMADTFRTYLAVVI